LLPETLSPEQFAAAVAKRLETILPKPVSVRVHGSDIGLYDPKDWGRSHIAVIVGEEDGRSLVERVETASRSILSFAQDMVMESSREQWPVGRGGVGYGDARVVGDKLHLWFGEEVAPIVSLAPVNLNKLVDGAA
jgi:hypothetical protein